MKIVPFIYFATKNEDKLKEIRSIMEGVGVLSLNDVDPGIVIPETGATFEENAAIKAEFLCGRIGAPALADDSGLEVDFLGGAPGVLSARFLGEDTPYSVKNQHITDALKSAGEGERGARFVCAIAFAAPGREVITTRAVIEGQIAITPDGGGGFGYDPIFYLPELGKTMARLTLEEKNAISHRGLALRQMYGTIKKLYPGYK